jgi:tryptophan synthase beta chain
VQATAAPEAPSKQTWERPDAAGRYGKFGGKYVPETLIPALAELEVAYKQAMADPAFQVGTVITTHVEFRGTK